MSMKQTKERILLFLFFKKTKANELNAVSFKNI